MVCIDEECRPLCCALNALPGITTVESCCGHGKTEFHVWFRAETIEALCPLVQAFDYHSGVSPEWRILLYCWYGYAATSAKPPLFLIEGPVGANPTDVVRVLQQIQAARAEERQSLGGVN